MQDKFTESRTQERLMAEGVIQALVGGRFVRREGISGVVGFTLLREQ